MPIVYPGSGQYDFTLKIKPLKIDESVNILFKQIRVHAIGIEARAKYDIHKTVHKYDGIFLYQISKRPFAKYRIFLKIGTFLKHVSKIIF